MIQISPILLFLFLQQGVPRDSVIDDFESIGGWKATPSDGVSVELTQDSGVHGKSMRIDFDFHGHGGYAVVRRDVKLSMPANYEFSFSIRGAAPVNTLEFKLVDSTGDNVWWANQTGFVFPAEWRRVSRKKRHISFAWGPLGGGEAGNIAAIEFAITAGTGGKGSVWLDDLSLAQLDPETEYALKPLVTAAASLPGHEPFMVFDKNPATSWRSKSRRFPGSQVLDIDFLRHREFGGLMIEWEKGRRPSSYSVSTSLDGSRYAEVYSVGKSTVSRDYLYLPESDARYLRVSVSAATRGTKARYVGLKEITVQPLAWAASMNDFLTAVARDAFPGAYPRYFSNKQSYWTVVGVNGDTHEGLLDTRGILETGKARFSIEPFLRTGNRLSTWADVSTRVSDAGSDLPIPSVMWSASPLELTVTAYASGVQGSSVLFGKYRIRNPSSVAQRATLYLALRPFQVNPPWQFLNTPGGFARVDSISFDGKSVRVNADQTVLSISRPVSFGAISFDQGNIPELLRAGVFPSSASARDKLGLASGVLSYDIRLAPHSDSIIYVAVPLHSARPDCMGKNAPAGCTAEWAAAQLDSSRSSWTADLGKVRIQLPRQASRITESIRSNLAYILINRDGPAIQPGSRSYERSWIRDGSLTSAALLRLGHAKEVREFLEWYAGFQFANGKVPCCVDSRGADPVPENDSHGEFIYLAAEYFRHTGDSATLIRIWPHVAKAFAFMDSLRMSRTTANFQAPDSMVFFGLLPQSISHEGYSAKPMHSYWDDFFALRGFKDAVEIARILGKPEAARYATVRDQFQADLRRSISIAMTNHRIDYIPGAAELGDFDATSTTIGVNPGDELGGPLESAIRRTFDRYYEDFTKRRDGIKPWGIYTPYEWRVVGTFVRLGEKARAHQLVDFFFKGQRPREWHQWAEVVWANEDTARFIGDMPHTWVGSDYIRSVLDMFAYERDADSSLVIAAGIKEDWVREDNGLKIEGLSTHYGSLSYSMRARSNVLEIRIEKGLRLPPGGRVIDPPLSGKPREILLNAVSLPVARDIRVRELPAVLMLRY